MKKFNGPRKSITLGDVVKSTDKATGADKKLEKDGEMLDSFSLKVFIPDDIDMAGIGQPSIILTKDQYINFRVHSGKEIDSMPEWKQKSAQLKAWINLPEKK